MYFNPTTSKWAFSKAYTIANAKKGSSNVRAVVEGRADMELLGC